MYEKGQALNNLSGFSDLGALSYKSGRDFV